MSNFTTGTISIFVALLACLVAGCKGDRDKDQQQQTPSSVAPKSATSNPGDAAQPLAAPAPTTTPSGTERQSAGGASWDLPAGWSKGPAQQMRLQTLTDGKVDIAINKFPGDVGGVLPNINRWRGQIGLEPLSSESDAEKAMTDLDVAGRKVRMVDLTGPQGRMLVAIVPGEGQLYFFKMMGNPELVAARKDVFDRFVRSIRVQRRAGGRARLW